MKEHGNKQQQQQHHPVTEMPARALKSLLKKPGQARAKGPKNRVVINEKLNEFFAADYIIVIKEECCADYEEECDCCCQEHEMIRLGNCKECRAELNLQLSGGGGSGAGGALEERREDSQDNTEDEEEEEDEDEGEDEGEDEEEEEEEEEEEDEEDDHAVEAASGTSGNCSATGRDPVTPQRHQQQHETLSPPEGYKDVCEETEDGVLPTCSECNYYHHQQQQQQQQQQVQQVQPIQQRTAADEREGEYAEVDPAKPKDDDKSIGNIHQQQTTNDQAQQTTPDLHQRYLVETITMTTVTERRIVREISEEESQSRGKPTIDETDRAVKPPLDKSETALTYREVESSVENKPSGAENDHTEEVGVPARETPDVSELSLTFKMGNVSLVSNSLKPNSAVRQLFPDPRFISPPPAAAAKIMPVICADDSDDAISEAHKFLITTESLRLFDTVKRSKIASRSESCESEPNCIKRTIERNTLRRSLIGKYDSKKKQQHLRTKDLTLEERIRQLTCVDQDEENPEESGSIDEGQTASEFPIRTSPSGEERPNCLPVPRSNARSISQEQVLPPNSVASSPSQIQSQTQSQSQSQSQGQSHHHHHHHHHQYQSTYKRLTDLFGQKKNSEGNLTGANLPDLGIGNKLMPTKSSIMKLNSEARKQFLASLAPLSCVSSTDVDGQEDYYKLAKATSSSSSSCSSGNNRDSVGYNSDSSYSLDDIDAALARVDERNGKTLPGPPDITRGTPTGNAPDLCDSTADELLAFVEQDKSRMERIKRRYNEPEERHDEGKALNGSGSGVSGKEEDGENDNKDNNDKDNDEDDELNDYGFNRRPSVRGIKPQFETTDEIVRQLRSRTVISSSIPDARPTGLHLQGWPCYDKNGDAVVDRKGSFNIEQEEPEALGVLGDGYCLINKEDHDTNTINRINTMQKQIDDIYQTIAETAVNVQGSVPYLDGTLPRTLYQVRSAMNNETCHRYPEQKNGVLHFQEQHHHPSPPPPPPPPPPGARLLRIAGGGDETPPPGSMYGTLPTKARRQASTLQAISNYHCALVPTNAPGPKCYRTMYFVPYNGISDPTYQNIQRILPPHSSSNYAAHIERYPYPRNNAAGMRQEQVRYYSRPVALTTATTMQQQQQQQQQRQQPQQQPPPLHLHLHHQHPEDPRVPNATLTIPHGAVHPLQLQQQQQQQHHHHHHHHQQQQQQQQLPPYSIHAVPPPYPVIATTPRGSATVSTSPPDGYIYQVHVGHSAADVQTQTVSLPVTTSCGGNLLTPFNEAHAHSHLHKPGNASSSSSSSSTTSSVLSSPTKMQQQRSSGSGSCMMVVAERGVPEGAASAPSHDFSQAGPTGMGHAGNAIPPANTQNSVYYAMNV